MTVKWGGTTCTAIKWGSTTCTAVYWGGTKVFPDSVSFTIIVYNNKSYSYTVNSGTIWRTWVGSGRTLNTTKITVGTNVGWSRETASGSTQSGIVKADSRTGTNQTATTVIAAKTYYAY